MYGTAEDLSAEELLVHITTVLKTATPGAIHKTLVSVTTVDDLVLVLGPEDNDGRDKGALSDSAVLGVPKLLVAGTVLAILVFIGGIVWFAHDRKKRVNLIFSDPAIMYNMTRKNPRNNNRGSGSGGGIFDFFIPRKEKKRGDFYDPGANSLRHSPETEEAVDFGAGNMLLLTDGRPVEVDFDQNYKSNMAETSEGIV
jgi:hypothetical protein